MPGYSTPNTGLTATGKYIPGNIMKYSFKNEYRINASPDIIWNILSDVESWPEIWKYFRVVELRGNDKILKQNMTIDCEVRAVLPYTFRFNTEIVKIIPLKELEVISRGDLNGRGLWTLDQVGESTLSSFTWEVEPENKFIKVLGYLPFGRSLLCFSHNIMMENGYRSLLALLEHDKCSKPS